MLSSAMLTQADNNPYGPYIDMTTLKAYGSSRRISKESALLFIRITVLSDMTNRTHWLRSSNEPKLPHQHMISNELLSVKQKLQTMIIMGHTASVHMYQSSLITYYWDI